MAWSALSADRPLPNEGVLRFGLGAAAAPLWAPFLAAAGAGVAWWWATAWTRGPLPAFAGRRIEVKTEPAPTVEAKVIEVPAPAEVAEVAADVHAVAVLETAPLSSDAEAVQAAVAGVITARGGDGAKPAARRKTQGPKATV